MSGEVRDAADKANDNKVVEWGARLGYAVSGLLHLLIAWIAVQVAFGHGGKQASQSGALATVARQPFGTFLLWLAVAGFVLLAVWQVTEVITRHDLGDRAKAAAKAVMYLALGWTSYKFATGNGSNSNAQTRDFTAKLLHQTGGEILVAIIGLVIIGVGGYHIYKGWKERFLRDLQEHPGHWAVLAGRIGYIGKGVALVVVGFLFLTAAWHHSAKKTTGLDGALRTLRDAPLGQVLLVAVALGIAAYGVYSFARARYARV